MTVEALFFYGITIAEDDPRWLELIEEYDRDSGQIIEDFFHGGSAKNKARADLAESCRLNLYGDLRYFSARHYLAIAETESYDRGEGTEIDPARVNDPNRDEWDSRLRNFCEVLGISFQDPGWILAFWWC